MKTVQNLKIMNENQFLVRGHPQRLLLVQHNRQNVLDIDSSDSEHKSIKFLGDDSIDRSLAHCVLNQGQEFQIVDEL